VVRPFEGFEKVGNAVVAQSRWKAHLARRHYESLSWLRVAAGLKSLAKQVVHSDLEGLAGTPDLFPN
jgi:hypothetical protein